MFSGPLRVLWPVLILKCRTRGGCFGFGLIDCEVCDLECTDENVESQDEIHSKLCFSVPPPMYVKGILGPIGE